MPATELRWTDLETRGFLHVPAFLTPAQLQRCRDDYAASKGAGNRNYDVPRASLEVVEPLRDSVVELVKQIEAHTRLRVDSLVGSAYFATKRGVQFDWHQDHESYFMFQNHYNYLNLYIPVVKPQKDKSNLSVVAFDVLERESPATFKRIVSRGAAEEFRINGAASLLTLDDSGETIATADFDRIGVTPELEAGDLLVLRGDILHKTQDTDTDRVSLSVRLADGNTVVRRAVLANGGLRKAQMMTRNFRDYELVFRSFEKAGADHMPLSQLLLRMAEVQALPPSTLSPKRFLLREKIANHVVLSTALAVFRELVMRRVIVRRHSRQAK